MNVNDLIRDLAKLHDEWNKNIKSPDLAERGEWIRGVIYGIMLAIKKVKENTGWLKYK